MTPTGRLRLGVNVDHVATLRNARGGAHPDPLRAALAAVAAGADGVTVHLREDRRHIVDEDVTRMMAELSAPLNLEMAATDEMLAIALREKPHAVCLVPERREERTTEGGLNVVGEHNRLAPLVRELVADGRRVSLFIEADPGQIEAAAEMRAPVIELHTGGYHQACIAGDVAKIAFELTKLREGARRAAALGLEVHAGHGLDFDNVGAVAAIAELAELNIGHYLVGEAIFAGLGPVVAEMRRLMDAARGGDAVDEAAS
ncbi:MAG: pyridoxine 5'-phosphate synthase [Neomegalonema sp.]|nr:pyridoxine 5'-phosphate synthase [Neomegalonema sp.]